MERTCFTCKYCVMKDEGYSNYTVEGTTVDCLKGAHPVFPADRFYGEDDRLRIDYAKQCTFYAQGDPVEIDVDRDSLPRWDSPLSAGYGDDDDVKALLDAWDK